MDSRLSSASSDSSMIDGFYDFDEEVRSRSSSVRYSTDSTRTIDFTSFKKEDELWVLESLSMKKQSAEAVAEYYRRNPRVPRIHPSPSFDNPPPVQAMDRSADQKNRIPAHVFASDPSANWSVASNESLFSIHAGNMSFSKDQAISSHPEKTAKNWKNQEAEDSAETMKAVSRENETKNASTSNKSFAYSAKSRDGEKNTSIKLPGSSLSKSSKGSKESEEKLEEQNDAANAAVGAPLGGFSWLSCFPCCRGSPATENPPLEESGDKPEADDGKKIDDTDDGKKSDDHVAESKGKAGLNGKEEFSFSC